MSTLSSSRPAVHTSPKQRILDTIASQASAGKISSTDQTAFTSAVDDIDTSLTSGSSPGSSGTERLAPSDMKSRIDDLIGNEVSNGTLTSDQATTLKAVFAQGGGGKGGGQGGVGGVGGHGGPPPGPPPAGLGSDDSAASIGTSSAAASSTDTASTSDLLASFIKQLQATQSQTSAYSASGSSGGSKLTSALLLNFEA